MMNILVTDCQELAGLGVVRSLGRSGHTVKAGFPFGIHPSAIHSRWCSSSCSYPDPWKNQFDFREWILSECKKGKFDAIFPVTEAAIVAVSAIKKQIPSHIKCILPSNENLHFTLSKVHTNRAAYDAGLPVPRTSKLMFPYIIKSDNILTKGGVYIKGQHFVVYNDKDARSVRSACQAIGADFMEQEIVKGSGIGVSMLRWNGKIQLKFSHSRLHEVPWTGGASSYRVALHDPHLEDLAKKLLEHIDYEGIAMVEFKREGKSGTPYLMEINGRPWGSIALALHAGIDFPSALIDCVTNGKPDKNHIQREYANNQYCRNMPGEIKYVLSVVHSSKKHGRPLHPSKIRSLLNLFLFTLNPRIHGDYFWWNDPIPGVIQTLLACLDVKGGIMNTAKSLYRHRSNRRTLKKAFIAKPPVSPTKILFLCFGNICRSAFAEMYWSQKIHTTCSAISAGLCEIDGRFVPDHARSIIKLFGVDASGHQSKRITKDMVEHVDAVFLMDIKNWNKFTNMFPEARSKTFFLGTFSGDKNIEISDPCRKCPYKFDPIHAHRVFEKIVRSLDALHKHIQ
jgi:protein-tyrosine-phosphatase/predicted ATP-grasp superfamily ATP-dependent carboligase